MATLLRSSCAHKALVTSDLSTPLLHALAVAARKPASDCRADLSPGRYTIDAGISLEGILTVGEDTVAATSATPQSDMLLAFILAKLNSATREKLLRELPEDFATGGYEMPQADESLVDAVRDMLANLRRTVTRPRRGSVSGQLDLKLIPHLVMSRLSIVG